MTFRFESVALDESVAFADIVAMKKILFALLFLCAFERAQAAACEDISGIFEMNEDPALCGWWEEGDASREIHCKTYLTMVQTGCKSIKSFQRSIPVDFPRSASAKWITLSSKLTHSSGFTGFHTLVLAPDWQERTLCGAGRFWQKAEMLNGHLIVNILDGCSPEFTQHDIDLSNTASISNLKRTAPAIGNPAHPGSWTPWETLKSVKKVPDYPDTIKNTLLAWNDSRLDGMYAIRFDQKANEWLISDAIWNSEEKRYATWPFSGGEGNRSLQQSMLLNLKSEDFGNQLNSLSKKQCYACYLRGDATKMGDDASDIWGGPMVLEKISQCAPTAFQSTCRF